MKYQYPYVSHCSGPRWAIFKSIQDVSYSLMPNTFDNLTDSVVEMQRKAVAWDVLGFHSNAAYYREEAEIQKLDAYRMGVELGFEEEDEDKEEAIRELIKRGP